MDNDSVPYLDCSNCGEALFPATGRGFYNDDGECINHDMQCRCGRCDWMWTEGDAETCECGSLCSVDVYDGSAGVSEVT